MEINNQNWAIDATNELLQGLKVDAKTQKARIKRSGNPVVFYLTESHGNTYISKIGKLQYIKEFYQDKQLSYNAKYLLCERVAKLFINKGYAKPLVIEGIRSFLFYTLKNNDSQLFDEIIKKSNSMINHSMSAYFKDLSMKRYGDHYHFVTKEQLVDGKYLPHTIFDTPEKVIFVNAALGIGKTVACATHLALHWSNAHHLLVTPRIALTISLANSMNESFIKHCPHIYSDASTKTLNRIAKQQGIKNTTLSVKDGYGLVSQYEIKDDKKLQQDIANDYDTPIKTAFTLDSLLKLIDDGINNIALFNEHGSDLFLQRKGNQFVLVLDEIELLMQHFLSETIKKPTEILRMLKQAIRIADKVIVMDAFLSQYTIDFINEIAKSSYKVIHAENTHIGNIQVRFYSGSSKHGAGLNALLNDCEKLSKTDKKQRKTGKIAISTNTASEAVAIAKKLNDAFCNNKDIPQHQTLNIGCYTSGKASSGDKLIVYRRMGKNDNTTTFDVSEIRNNANGFLRSKNIDVFIYSPVMESGTSIDKMSEFTKLYAFASPAFGNSTAKGLLQTFYRFRNTIEWNISISTYNGQDNENFSMNSLDDYIRHVKKRVIANAKMIQDAELDTSSYNDIYKQILRDTSTDKAMEYIADLASGTYQFTQEWHDITKIKGIQHLAVTRFANFIYFELLAMGIKEENIRAIITDDDINTNEERKAIKQSRLDTLANTPFLTSSQDGETLYNDKNRRELSKDEYNQLWLWVLGAKYGKEGVYDAGKSVLDMEKDSITYGKHIDLTSLDADSRAIKIDAMEKDLHRLNIISGLNNDLQNIVTMINLTGVGINGKFKADESKLPKALDRSATAITANQLIKQFESDDGVTKESLIENGIHEVLGSKPSSVIKDVKILLTKEFGIESSAFSDKRERRKNGKRVHAHRLNTEKWKAQPVYKQAMMLQNKGLDSTNQYVEKVAKYLTENSKIHMENPC